jgi:hypothetical protein
MRLLRRRTLGFLELNEETDRCEGNWILRPVNCGKAVRFRRTERESGGGDVRDSERDGLRLEREERARDSAMVAIEKMTIRLVRLVSISICVHIYIYI